MIGQYTGMSPKKTDVLIRGYLGTLGTTFTSVFDGIIGSSGTRPKGFFGDPTDYTAIAANAAGFNRFVKIPEQLGNKYVSDFYQIKQDAQQISTSIKHAIEAGDIDAVKEKLARNPAAISANRSLSRIENQITKINQQIRALQNNPSLPSEEKYKRLTVLRNMKAQLSEQGVSLGQQFGL
jgi:hypothetical protein